MPRVSAKRYLFTFSGAQAAHNGFALMSFKLALSAASKNYQLGARTSKWH